MPNEVSQPNQESSQLRLAAAKITNYYINDVANLNEAVGVPLTEESKRCATNVIVSLCGEIGATGVQSMPREQLLKVLQFVTINGLDIFNGQVYLDKRKDAKGNIVSINATPMGSAYEIMTARFGVGVKKVHQARIVHEGDEFELPQFDGLSCTNIKHKTTLKGLDGKSIAAYYVIEMDDGRLEYAIATREGVAKNLMAQILNASLRKEVDRGALMKHMEGKTLDELLSDGYLAQFISPSYRSPATRESMIITKMKKNALLHYTRDLGVKNKTAFEEVNANLGEENDMVVSQQDGEEAPKPSGTAPRTNIIQDFEVSDEGVATPQQEAPHEAENTEQGSENAPSEAVEAEVEKPKQEQPQVQGGQAEQPSVFEVV